MVYWVWLVFEAQFYHFHPSFIPRLKSWAFWGTDRKLSAPLILPSKSIVGISLSISLFSWVTELFLFGIETL